MIRFKEVEGKGGTRTLERRWVPAHAKQLSVAIAPRGGNVASTKCDLHFVPPIGVDDCDGVGWRLNRTRVATVPKVTSESEGVEGGSVEEPVLPGLGAV